MVIIYIVFTISLVINLPAKVNRLFVIVFYFNGETKIEHVKYYTVGATMFAIRAAIKYKR